MGAAVVQRTVQSLITACNGDKADVRYILGSSSKFPGSS